MGINLEGSVLEPQDFNKGAERDASTLDGLYFYTEPERDAAAEYLWDYFYNEAYLKAEWWRTLFTDAPTDLANEMVNCFANDTCDRSSTAWWFPGVGRSVSPDNIFFWDSPETGGVYGYQENLFYREGVYRAVTTWQESEGVGAIVGQVFLNGSSVQDASVNILTLELFTDQYGYFQDNLIPEGRYSINASKIVGDRLYYAEDIITVQAGQTTYISLTLEPPPSSLRQIIIQGYMKIHDAETGGGSTQTFNDVFASTLLSPNPPPEIDPEPDLDPSTQTFKIKRCVDDEVSAIVTMTLTLLPDYAVEISTETKLYDDDGPFGYNCYEGDDVEAISYHNFLVPIDTVSVIEIPHLEDDGDWVEAYFAVVNQQRP
jgi:hypothetical protein